MSSAYDREREIIQRASMLYKATGKVVQLYPNDYDFLKKRKKIDSFGKVDNIPVERH